MNTNAKLTRNAKALIAVHLLYNVAALFLNTFFISFVMRNVQNEIEAISVLTLSWFIIQIIAFFALVGKLKTGNKINVFRLSVLPSAICCLMIIGLGSEVVHWVIPMGILLGMRDALHWLPMHTMAGEVVAKESMTKFTSYRTMMTGITRVVAPVLLGFFITIESYESVAGALLVVCALDFLCISLLKPPKKRVKKSGPDFAGLYRSIKRTPLIRKLFLIEVLNGISMFGALSTVITMYTVYLFKTDLNLGIFTTVFAMSAILTNYVFGKFGQPRMFPPILVVSTIGLCCSLLLFVFAVSEATFILYNLVSSIAITLISSITMINVYNVSKKSCVKDKHKIEYFTLREAMLTIGRMIAFGGLLLIGIYGGYEWLRWYLVFLIMSVVAIGYLSIKINRYIK
ncbi:MAG: MFS transporter [Alphaproteobacteria bacterium]|nr:MFS transporter [Alphaproteobacteria bacterium]